ncbi:hypothetical protein [Pseudonocardia alni]|uniref:hypothetical protein n=1 Tax=Pseudonocardia alni TaxID=33907 RepID=UPI00332D8DB3
MTAHDERRRTWHLAQVDAHEDPSHRISAAVNFLRAATLSRTAEVADEFADAAVAVLVALADAALSGGVPPAVVDLERPAEINQARSGALK